MRNVVKQCLMEETGTPTMPWQSVSIRVWAAGVAPENPAWSPDANPWEPPGPDEAEQS